MSHADEDFIFNDWKTYKLYLNNIISHFKLYRSITSYYSNNNENRFTVNLDTYEEELEEDSDFIYETESLLNRNRIINNYHSTNNSRYPVYNPINTNETLENVDNNNNYSMIRFTNINNNQI